MTGPAALPRRGLALLALVLGVAGLWTFRLWPAPPRPAQVVPTIEIARGSAGGGMAIELVPPVEGLAAVPMLVTGRASAGAKGALMQEWPGFHVEARFYGTEIRVRFQDASNRWRVLVDEGRTARIDLSRPGAQDLRLRGLSDGEHRLRVEKTSESSMPASFGGVLVGPGARGLPAPEPRARLIEFIGDSDTVGFANGAEWRDCTEGEVFSSTDTTRSFGPQVAQALGADYRIIARSGIGLLRNYGGAKPGATMASRYGLALPSEPAATRLPQKPADIVVTGLGSNDFGSDFDPSEPWTDQQALSRDFQAALVRFLGERVRDNPGALQVLLAFGEYGAPLVSPYSAALDSLKADGARAVLVVLPKLDRTACFWHPSADDHAMIRDQILAAILAAGES